MLIKILITLTSFMLFIFIFFFKLIKKNDTNYLWILGMQTIGILVNFIQIIFKILKNSFWNGIIYVFAIIIPILVFVLEYKKINISELMYIAISKYYMSIGNDKKAKKYLIQLTTKYPDSYGAHKNLAKIYEKEGGMRKAIEEYVKTLEIKRNDYKSYFSISVLLKDLGRNKQAVQMLHNLLKYKPDHFEATEMMSELLLDSGEYKKAITFINKALKTFEDNEVLIYNLGIAYARMNEFSLAKKCFEQNVSLNNNNYNAYYRLGQIALLYRDFEMAEMYFENSAYNEKEAKSYYQLTKVFIIRNQKDKAGINIQKAINIDSSFYKIAKEEPMFYPIKQYIRPAKNNSDKKVIEKESKKELMIEDYLNDTYNLTKVLNKKEDKNNFEWNKRKKKKRV